MLEDPDPAQIPQNLHNSQYSYLAIYFRNFIHGLFILLLRSEIVAALARKMSRFI